MVYDLSFFLGVLDFSVLWCRGSFLCFRNRKIEFFILVCMCVEGNVDELLVVIKVCLFILNVKEVREGMFFNKRIGVLFFGVGYRIR